MPIPIIASDMTITSTSIVSHLGMRFAGWVIACALRSHVICRKSASGCERVHMFEQSPPPSPGVRVNCDCVDPRIPRFADNAPFRGMIFGELACTPPVRHANFCDRLFFILGLGVLG